MTQCAELGYCIVVIVTGKENVKVYVLCMYITRKPKRVYVVDFDCRLGWMIIQFLRKAPGRTQDSGPVMNSRR